MNMGLYLPMTEYQPKFRLDQMGPPSGPYQDVQTQSATQNFAIAQGMTFRDGRKFRYTLNGAADITRALMQQSADTTATAFTKYVGVTQTGHAQAVGDREITVLVTTGGTPADNAFAGGYIVFTTGAQLDVYRILASKLDATDTLMHLLLAEPIKNVVAATAKASLIPSRWYKTIVAPATTLTGPPSGVPLCDVTAGYFYWAQTKGPCPMTVDAGETLVIGSLAGVPATDAAAGTVGVVTATALAFPVYGRVLYIAAAGESALIDLIIEP
jgi:hypothetical protein